VQGILVDTDILFAHLTGEAENSGTYSLLEYLMRKEICFTTVLNATELYLCCETAAEKSAVRKLLNGINILGIHPRYALQMEKDEYTPEADTMRSLFFATAVSNKMKIATLNKECYPPVEEQFVDLIEIVSGEKN